MNTKSIKMMFDVRPLNLKTNLDDIAKRIINEITVDGCYWNTEYKKEQQKSGFFILRIGATVEDEKVSVDELLERIEAMEDQVQSVEICKYKKIR